MSTGNLEIHLHVHACTGHRFDYTETLSKDTSAISEKHRPEGITTQILDIRMNRHGVKKQ